MASSSATTIASPSSSSGSGITERRGIPGAQFVEDVQTYLNQLGLDVTSALAVLQERSLSIEFCSKPCALLNLDHFHVQFT